MEKFEPEKLRKIAENIFKAAGTPEGKAELVSRMLVNANLAGHDSHGVIRVLHYVDHINSGLIVPDAGPELEIDYPSFGSVKGNRAFGQVVMTYAVKIAIEKAKQNGMVMIGCSGMGHAGRLGDYVSMVADEDLLGLALCNGGGPNVAPYGSRKRVLGTNPIACAVPLQHGDNIEIDFASASTAEGKLCVARNQGNAVKHGLIIGSDGNPTRDPNKFYQDGAILPIGEHKGSGLSLILEIFGGIFTGGRCSAFQGYLDGNGILMFVMKPDLFRDRKEFERDVEVLQKAVVEGDRARGTNRIYFPGEKEKESVRRLTQDGITLDDKTWGGIKDVAQSLNVKI